MMTSFDFNNSWCYNSTRVFLKIDFAKPFDIVQRETIKHILDGVGYNFPIDMFCERLIFIFQKENS